MAPVVTSRSISTNLNFLKHRFCPSSVKITYICSMIWFKKMPSTKSMYKVRLSWLPLPNGPRVFTCGERKVGSHPHVHSLKLSRAKADRARVGRRGVTQSPPTLQQAPSLPFPQGLSTLPATDNEHETAGGKLPRHFSPASQSGKRKYKDFSINFPRLKSM